MDSGRRMVMGLVLIFRAEKSISMRLNLPGKSKMLWVAQKSLSSSSDLNFGRLFFSFFI